jgi:uncharacterized protein (DUF488 family)
LFSIGYQNLGSNRELVEHLAGRGIEILLDVRSHPHSKRKDFSKNELAQACRSAGISYEWRGDVLGGHAPISEATIEDLAAWQKNRRVCLLCLEADPDRCHRKREIGRRLEAYSVEMEHLTVGRIKRAAPRQLTFDF